MSAVAVQRSMQAAPGKDPLCCIDRCFAKQITLGRSGSVRYSGVLETNGTGHDGTDLIRSSDDLIR